MAAELKTNTATRHEVKRDFLNRLLGRKLSAGGYPRIYLEESGGDYECIRHDVPTSAAQAANGAIVNAAFIAGLTGTWIFVEEPQL